MAGTRARLEARKRDIYAALRVLETDHQEGTVDDTAYQRTRRRYEQEAAKILERLDGLETRSGTARSVRRRSLQPLALGGVAAVIVLAGLGLLLINALNHRTGTTTITGNGGSALASTPVAASQQALVAAEATVRLHPRDVNALLALGNAYLTVGKPLQADAQFRQAMALAPNRPEPETFHAMILSSTPKRSQALALMHAVERSHPTYSRVWLLNGLVAAQTRPGYGEALRCWRRFLVLVPKGTIAHEVRGFIAGLQKSHASKK